MAQKRIPKTVEIDGEKLSVLAAPQHGYVKVGETTIWADEFFDAWHEIRVSSASEVNRAIRNMYDEAFRRERKRRRENN